MANNPGCYASNEAFIDTTEESNSLGLSLHPPSSMNYYPPEPSTCNNVGHLTLGRSPSSKISGPQLCELSDNVKPDWNNVNNTTGYHEHNWFNSDITLNYINNLLMQEDSDDKVKLHHGESALTAMEDPFYKLLGESHPSYPHQLPLLGCDYLKNYEASNSMSHPEPCTRCSVAIDSIDSNTTDVLQCFESPWSLSAIVGESNTQDTYQMELGLNINELSIAQKPSKDDPLIQVNNNDTNKDALLEIQRQKSYPCTEGLDLLEERSNKKFALSYDEPIRDEMFDKILLNSGHKPLDGGIVLQGTAAAKSTKSSQNQERTSSRRKIKGKKEMTKEWVDLSTLLIHCAEAVSVNNHTLARDLLKTIRQHSSASGDDSQRLAFCLEDCLEVRLAGTGSYIYHKLTSIRSNARDMLKVLHLNLSVCPALRAPYHFSNKTILDVSMGKPRVHIIDFGICFGFQWPSLFEQLSKREGGPPSVRITGIDLPQPGFRPEQMTMNTGQRLAEYAKMFNVSFEFQGIASKWETICAADLDIQKDEVLIVNCIYKLKNLGDEMVSVDCARNKVLNTIRLMKPNVFIVVEVNGSYSTPFFLTRFKEVMYHYSALFDVLDKNVPRDNKERTIMEREIILAILINVIACEGSERIERPETYKKWRERILNAGFEQLPLNAEIVKGTKDMVKRWYHKDFVVNEDQQWLLLGWKGRICYGMSTWKPNESSDGD